MRSDTAAALAALCPPALAWAKARLQRRSPAWPDETKNESVLYESWLWFRKKPALAAFFVISALSSSGASTLAWSHWSFAGTRIRAQKWRNMVGAKRTKAMTTEGNWSFKKCPSMATAFSSSRSNFWFVKSLSKDSWLSYNPFVQTCWANMFVFPNRIENIKPKQATAAAHHFLLCSWPVRLVSICFTARGGLEPKWHSHFGNYIDNT